VARETDPLHVAPNGTVVTSKVRRDGSAEVTICTLVVNNGDERAKMTLHSDMGVPPMRATSKSQHGRDAHVTTTSLVGPMSSREVTQKVVLKRPRLWSPDKPNLYTLTTTLSRGRDVVDTYDTTFGIRTTRWDANRGFFLNGQPLKIKGLCNHEDHAGLGVAGARRGARVPHRKLKEAGANAYRAAHNCATSDRARSVRPARPARDGLRRARRGSHAEALDSLGAHDRPRPQSTQHHPLVDRATKSTRSSGSPSASASDAR
jgi:beta-galactosidase